MAVPNNVIVIRDVVTTEPNILRYPGSSISSSHQVTATGRDNMVSGLDVSFEELRMAQMQGNADQIWVQLHERQLEAYAAVFGIEMTRDIFGQPNAKLENQVGLLRTKKLNVNKNNQQQNNNNKGVRFGGSEPISNNGNDPRKPVFGNNNNNNNNISQQMNNSVNNGMRPTVTHAPFGGSMPPVPSPKRTVFGSSAAQSSVAFNNSQMMNNNGSSIFGADGGANKQNSVVQFGQQSRNAPMFGGGGSPPNQPAFGQPAPGGGLFGATNNNQGNNNAANSRRPVFGNQMGQGGQDQQINFGGNFTGFGSQRGQQQQPQQQMGFGGGQRNRNLFGGGGQSRTGDGGGAIKFGVSKNPAKFKNNAPPAADIGDLFASPSGEGGADSPGGADAAPAPQGEAAEQLAAAAALLFDVTEFKPYEVPFLPPPKAIC